MKWFYFKYCTILVLLCACNKSSNLNVKLTPYDEQKIIGDGYFTDSLKKHQFLFTLSTDLGKNYKNYPTGVKFEIETPSGVQKFIDKGSGIFESEEMFKGNYGDMYTIRFTYNDTVHKIDTKMPFPIELNESYFHEFGTDIFTSRLGTVGLNIKNTQIQYLRFDLFIADKTKLPEDTVWIQTPLPVYRVAKLPVGDSVTVNLPIKVDDSFQVSYDDLVMVKTYMISKKVGDYLINLEGYVTSESQNNQFYNPPYYYSNEAYGLGYGTIVDSIVHQYQ